MIVTITKKETKTSMGAAKVKLFPHVSKERQITICFSAEHPSSEEIVVRSIQAEGWKWNNGVDCGAIPVTYLIRALTEFRRFTDNCSVSDLRTY